MSQVYSENFDGVTAPTLPAGYEASGTWITEASGPRSGANRLRCSTTSVSVFQDDAVSTNPDSTFTFAFLFTANDNGNIALAFVRSDATTTLASKNHYEARVTNTTGTTFTTQIHRRVAGAATQLGSTVTIGGGISTGVWYKGILRVVTTGGNPVVSWKIQRDSDSQWVGTGGEWQADEVACLSVEDSNVAKITTAGRGGVVCVNATGGRVVFEDLLFDEDSTSAITISSPPANKIFQRTGTTNGAGTASILIAGTYVGTPTTIQARWNGGTWTEIVASPAGGTYSGTLSNQGVNDNAGHPGQGAVEVRFSNDTGVTASVADIGIGEVFHVIGQSNAVGLMDNPQTYSAPASPRDHFKAAKVEEDGDWAQLTDHCFNETTEPAASGLGSIWPLVATALMADLQVPVGFVTTGKGTTGLVVSTEWAKAGTGTMYGKAVDSITVDALPNSIRGWLLFGFERDATTPGTNAATYEAALSLMLDDLQADCSLSGIKLLAGQISNYSSAVSEDALDEVRNGTADAWDDDADILPGPVTYDYDNVGATPTGTAWLNNHYTTNEAGQSVADRWVAAIEAAFFGGTEQHPRLVSATLTAANEITLTFDRTLTTEASLTVGAFAVTDDATPVTVSGASASGTDVTLALASSPTGEVLVSLGKGYDGEGATVPTGNGANALPAVPFVGVEVASGAVPPNPYLSGGMQMLTGGISQ